MTTSIQGKVFYSNLIYYFHLESADFGDKSIRSDFQSQIEEVREFRIIFRIKISLMKRKFHSQVSVFKTQIIKFCAIG